MIEDPGEEGAGGEVRVGAGGDGVEHRHRLDVEIELLPAGIDDFLVTVHVREVPLARAEAQAVCRVHAAAHRNLEDLEEVDVAASPVDRIVLARNDRFAAAVHRPVARVFEGDAGSHEEGKRYLVVEEAGLAADGEGLEEGIAVHLPRVRTLAHLFDLVALDEQALDELEGPIPADALLLDIFLVEGLEVLVEAHGVSVALDLEIRCTNQ